MLNSQRIIESSERKWETSQDVYKRQSLTGSMAAPATTSTMPEEVSPASPMKRDRSTSPTVTVSPAVSYTHLDVYKRQT